MKSKKSVLGMPVGLRGQDLMDKVALKVLGVLFLWAVVFIATFLAWAKCDSPAAPVRQGRACRGRSFPFRLRTPFPSGIGCVSSLRSTARRGAGSSF
jgi:hypothetical protein